MAYGSEVEKLERRWMENPMGVSFAPLAEAYRRAGDPARALEVLAIGLSNHPAYVPALIVQARCHLDAGARPAAEASFRAVLATDGHNLIALKGLADLCEQGDRPDQAIGHLERLLEADPTHDEARAQLERMNAITRERGQQGGAEVVGANATPAAAGELPGFEPTDAGSLASDAAEVASSLDPEENWATVEDMSAISLEASASTPPGTEPSADAEPPLAEAASGVPPEGAAVEMPVLEVEPGEAERPTAVEPPAPEAGPDDGFEVEKEIGPFDAFEPEEWSGPPLDLDQAPDLPFEEESPTPWSERWGTEPNQMEAGIDDALAAPAEGAQAQADAEWTPLDAGADGPAAEQELEQEAPAPEESVPAAAQVPEYSAEGVETGAGLEEADDTLENETLEPPLAADSVPIADTASVESPAPVVEPPRSWDEWAAEVVGEDPGPVDLAGVEEGPSAGLAESTAASSPDASSVVNTADDSSPFVPESPASAEDLVEVVEGSEAEVPAEVPPEIEPDMVITETMARLFERQGHKAMALAVYTELVVRDPGNAGLTEARNRLLGEVAPDGPVAPEGPSAPDGPVDRGESRVDQLLEAAPTRASDDLLSLDAVFGAPRAVAGRTTAADGLDGPPQHEPSFDEFFGEAGVGAGRREARGGADADLEQFNAWLRSLKR